MSVPVQPVQRAVSSETIIPGHVLAAILDGDPAHAILELPLAQIAAAFPDTLPLIVGPGEAGGAGAFAVAPPDRPEVRRACLLDLATGGPWGEGLRRMAEGALYTEEDFAPNPFAGQGALARLLRSSGPSTLAERFSGIVLQMDDGRPGALQVHHSATMNVAQRRALQDALRSCATQIVLARRIGMMRSGLTEARRLSFDLLELFPFPVILCDRNRLLSFANARARALIETGRVLTLGPDGGLHLPDVAMDATMQQRVDLLAAGGHPRASVMILPGKGRELLSLVRLDSGAVPGAMGDRDGALVMPRFAVIHGDLAHPPAMDRSLLWQVFGMNPKETDLALALLEGQSIGDLAVQNRVSKETLRNQLAAVMRKTATSRQQDLVAVLSRLATLNAAG